MGNTLPHYPNKSLQMIFPRESETRPLPLTLLDLKCYPACIAFCLHCGIQCHINTQTTQSQEDSLCLRDAPCLPYQALGNRTIHLHSITFHGEVPELT